MHAKLARNPGNAADPELILPSKFVE